MLFLDKNKKSITQQNTKSSQINLRRSQIFLEFFDIKTRLIWSNIKIKEDKIHQQCIKLCFTKHNLIKRSLGQMGLRYKSSPLFLFFFFSLEGGSNPAVLVGLDLTGPAWLLVHTSNRARQQARTN